MTRPARPDFARLFAPAPASSMRGESTPFYLWHRAAQRRISEQLPDARLIAVVRDPIDRAYSNWMHLWSDGLEPVADFETAFAREHERIAKGWAPFWRYAQLGRYGEQLDRACQFLGIAPGLIETIPHDNSRSFVEPGPRSAVMGRVLRAGAWAGQFAPPQVWRRASAPLIRRMSGGDAVRPKLSAPARARLLPYFADDIALLAQLTGESFDDWLSTESRGSFRERSKVS